MRAHGTEGAKPVSAVHTCHKGSRKVVRICSLAHIRLIGRATVCGRSNRMWSVRHRVMMKFEWPPPGSWPPRPAIRVSGPCRMQRQLIEKSYGFMGTGIGPPRLRARSALREKSSCGRDSSGMAGGWSGSAGGSNLAEPHPPLAQPRQARDSLVLLIACRDGPRYDHANRTIVRGAAAIAAPNCVHIGIVSPLDSF